MDTDKKNTPIGIIILGILSSLFGLMQVRRGLGLAIYPSYRGILGLILGTILIVKEKKCPGVVTGALL
ncbi:hypothetical protein [Methanoregula sp.]|jgi:hypothetical protein|uniref:hypothetical protein n=1 Tax=Methanoregula sp. TaxID=2052170 RepID=UPI003C2439D0